MANPQQFICPICRGDHLSTWHWAIYVDYPYHFTDQENWDRHLTTTELLAQAATSLNHREHPFGVEMAALDLAAKAASKQGAFSVKASEIRLEITKALR